MNRWLVSAFVLAMLCAIVSLSNFRVAIAGSEVSQVRLLLPWAFGAYELPEDCDGLWMGLYSDGHSMAVAEESSVSVKGLYYIEDGPDGPGEGYDNRYVQKFVDGKPVKFDYMIVSADKEENLIILIRGVSGLNAGPVLTSFVGNEIMEPDKSVDISTNQDRHCTITAKGILHRRKYEVENYSLQLVCGDKSQQLTTYESCNDNLPRLLWAGDMDGDGETDMLINMSNSYLYAAETLYLSTRAGEGEIVGKAAVLMRYGD